MTLAAVLRRRPSAWAHAPFRRLSAAWLATNIGDSALYLSVAVWVKDLTGSDAAAAVVFGVLGLSTLTGPLMGHLVDRVSRRRAMIVANLIGAAGVASLLLVTSIDQLWLVYVVIFGYGALGVLTGAAQGGLVRDILPDDDLASGNGLLSTIDQALRLISPLLGTALYVWSSPQAVVLLSSGTFALTALLLLRVQVDESEPEPAGESFGRSVSSGFRHLAATSPLGMMTVLTTIAFGATALINVAVFAVIEQGLGLPTASLGVIVSIQGIGAVVAGVTASTAIARIGHARTFAMGLGLVAVGAATLLTTSVIAVGAGAAAVGFGVTWTVVAFVTVRQLLTPARLQGRTSAATMMGITVPQALLTLVGAALIAVVDYRLLVGGTVLGVAVASAAAFRLRATVPLPGVSKAS